MTQDDIIDMALEAQPEQEPVAWITPDGEGWRIRFSPPTIGVPLGWDALYTAAAQRKPLTATVIGNMMPSTIPMEHDGALMEFARAIEAAHGIKEQP